MATLRPAAARDLTALLALEAQCFDAHDQWSDQSWRSELELADHQVLLAEDENGLLAAASFCVIEQDAELLRVMTLPMARRRGLAARLLHAGEAWARAAGATRILLEVEAQNRPSLELYQRFGWTELSVRRDYYGLGRDALIYAKELEL